jgi:hypothetical protein
MVLTIEEKLWAALLCVLIVCLCFGLYSIHLIDVGKADEKAAVFKVQQQDEAKAALLTAAWQKQLATAATARQGEIDAAKDESLKPVDVVQLQRLTLSSAVSASPAAPSGASAAGRGSVCSGLVPGSPGEMRSFGDAKSADALVADYRDLYNSWPSVKTNGDSHARGESR